MSLGIAFKAFFAALGNNETSAQIDRILAGERLGSDDAGKAISQRETQVVQTIPGRDSAVTLLATLQRESRLVDLIHEDLEQYSDAQVGAAARPCLQQCAGVLKRLLGLAPLLDASEGQTVDVPSDASPTRYQWIGEGTAASGKLVHHGWQANKLELPKWTGDVDDVNVIAPAQVQSA
ncbi:DUF2760 domain-containing protein [Roseiconus nitratireducens]|uniref:DUF2760 domain-containing protein n=1 Tax=Roseiconus nitratireducens TaxID=2605748 RepID=A0A5M6DGL8_9BACT|nr:DUF2760 domain-containing protein [Roseiconus nitratireducens]KAA5545430.1 DUF2760 domain-containing protein [Roseiconus nitratireducens]